MLDYKVGAASGNRTPNVRTTRVLRLLAGDDSRAERHGEPAPPHTCPDDEPRSQCLAHRVNFGDGEQWTCTECGRVETVAWDDDVEETIGLPSQVGEDEDGNERLVSDRCTAGTTPHDWV